MVIEYIRYRLKQSTPEALVAAYGAAGAHLQASPECLGYELTACEEEAGVFVLRIEWTSTEAHKKAFRRGPNFPPFFALIRPFLAEIEEMRHYAATDVAWTRPAQQ
ncbi:MAG: antibiotic biosynthesis monooxygenase [Hyphomicrobiales bacterium]|nr:MAG: antibiotic biosynthesis monooxygenase [Hyphomicrobiales bacterium]